MKNLLSLFAFSLLPFSLLAQSKPVARKAVPAKRPAATHVATTAPAKKQAPATKLASTPPASTAPAPQPQARQEQPVAAYVAPAPQAAPSSRPAARPVAPVSTYESRFRIGFRVGGNSSTIGGIDPETFGIGVQANRVMGFHGGVLFNFGGPSFSVQPEILYTQYGIKMTAGSDYLQLKYSIIEVPVLLKASFGQPNLRFFINAGPVATYTLGGTLSALEGGQSGSQKIDMTNEGRLSYGASGGAGVAIQAGPGAVQLEARYSYLFSTNDNGTNLHPQNAMLSVGYLIPLGGR
ncbi:porin family protein [Spirosoma sp. KNUC1025]|uniref:porin family protein n=1 Tax=Spirosoma sp. KNUC1025 TaxID=2894082 RepID=UPI003869D99A|nr:outer membrane beta-barrel protein [Spirosoma sp. KNUC1025]